MNKKKIIVLMLLLIAVIGFTMGSASAASSTFKLKSTYQQGKCLSHQDYIGVFYDGGLYVDIEGYYPWLAPTYHKLTKVKVYYKNKKTGKVITKTKKLGFYTLDAYFAPKKGYKMYKVKVWYRNLNKNERKKYSNRFIT